MVQLKDAERLMDLCFKRAIEPRDGMLMWALVSFMDPASGRIRATSEAIAQRMGSTSSEVRSGLSRLSKQHMVRRVRNRLSGEVFYRVNPWLIEAGKPQAVAVAMREFQEA